MLLLQEGSFKNDRKIAGALEFECAVFLVDAHWAWAALPDTGISFLRRELVSSKRGHDRVWLSKDIKESDQKKISAVFSCREGNVEQASTAGKTKRLHAVSVLDAEHRQSPVCSMFRDRLRRLADHRGKRMESGPAGHPPIGISADIRRNSVYTRPALAAIGAAKILLATREINPFAFKHCPK